MNHGSHYIVCVIKMILVCYEADMFVEMEQEMQIIRVRLHH